MLGANIFPNVSSYYINSFIIMNCLSSSFIIVFVLKSILTIIYIVTIAFFVFYLHETYFSIPVLSVCVSLGLKCVSYSSIYMGLDFIFIHSATLYLLIKDFSLSTLNYCYLLIVILLIVGSYSLLLSSSLA